LEKLTFSYQREILRFKVIDKSIWYSDRRWNAWIRCIPKDDDFIKKIIMSRNKIPKVLIEMFTLNKAEQAEYDTACLASEPEKALADNIIMDCKRKGVILVSREIEANSSLTNPVLGSDHANDAVSRIDGNSATQQMGEEKK
jgi:hypothetical protein